MPAAPFLSLERGLRGFSSLRARRKRRSKKPYHGLTRITLIRKRSKTF